MLGSIVKNDPFFLLRKEFHMLGAIYGDIVGSRFEFTGFKSKNFDLFTEKCMFTDDSLMTLAIAKTLLFLPS